MICAFVTTRVDIGSAITTLAQYNNTPGDKHFNAAQQVLAYLVDTKDKGLVYWRAKQREDLEYRIHDMINVDLVAPSDPWRENETNPFEIVTAVDCSYAICTKGRSMTRVLIWFGGHLIC